MAEEKNKNPINDIDDIINAFKPDKYCKDFGNTRRGYCGHININLLIIMDSKDLDIIFPKFL